RRGDSKTFPSSGGGVAAKQTGWLFCVHPWLREVCSLQLAAQEPATDHQPRSTLFLICVYLWLIEACSWQFAAVHLCSSAVACNLTRGSRTPGARAASPARRAPRA